MTSCVELLDMVREKAPEAYVWVWKRMKTGELPRCGTVLINVAVAKARASGVWLPTYDDVFGEPGVNGWSYEESLAYLSSGLVARRWDLYEVT